MKVSDEHLVELVQGDSGRGVVGDGAFPEVEEARRKLEQYGQL